MASLLLVASNVGTDIGVINNDNNNWEPVELEWTTPCTPDDEFMFPTGLARLDNATVAIATTDGAVTVFRGTVQEQDHWFAPLGLEDECEDSDDVTVVAVDRFQRRKRNTTGERDDDAALDTVEKEESTKAKLCFKAVSEKNKAGRDWILVEHVPELMASMGTTEEHRKTLQLLSKPSDKLFLHDFFKIPGHLLHPSFGATFCSCSRNCSSKA